MLISRNQMILDLIAHFREKCVYKNASQREAWGYLDDSIILANDIQESSWRTFFLREKNETDREPDILDRESIP